MLLNPPDDTDHPILGVWLMDYKGCGRGVGMSLIEWLIFTGRVAFEIRWAFFHMGLNRDIT